MLHWTIQPNIPAYAGMLALRRPSLLKVSFYKRLLYSACNAFHENTYEVLFSQNKKKPVHPTCIAAFETFEACHEIIVLFVLRKVILHVQPSSGARCLIFGQTLRLLPYFRCANSEGSGETAHARLSLR